MKIVRSFSSPLVEEAGGPFLVCADTARSNRGEPVFVRYPTHAHCVMPCLYARMLGVCKAVSEPEARAFLDGVGSALHFCDATLLALRRGMGAPLSEAYSFDRSIVAGPLEQMESGHCGRLWEDRFSVRLAINGETQAEISLGDVGVRLLRTVASASSVFTINSGDWLLLPLLDREVSLPLPGRLQLYLQGVLHLDEIVR